MEPVVRVDAASCPPPAGAQTRFIRGVASGYAVKLSTAALGVLVTPFLLSRLGSRDFGVYVLLTSLIPWLALMDLGFVPALRIHLARELGKARPRPELPLAVAWYGQWLVIVLVLIAGTCSAPHVATFFGTGDSQTILLIQLLTIAFAVTKLSDVFGAVLSAHQRIDLQQTGRAVQSWVRAGLIVAALMLGGELGSLGLAWIAAALAGGAWLLFRTWQLIPARAFSPTGLESASLTAMFSSGIWLSIGAAAGLLIVGADRAIIGRFVSLEDVARFSITASLYVLAETLLNHFVDAGRPMLSAARGQGDSAGAAAIYDALRKTVRPLGWIAALAILSVNQAFVTVWVGLDQYGGLLLDAALALNLVVQTTLIPERAALSAALRMRPATLSRLAEGVLNLVLSIALVMPLRAAGVAFATAIAALTTSAWYLPGLARREYFANQPISPSAAPSPWLLVAVLAALLLRLGGGNSAPWTTLCLVTTAAGIGTLWLLSPRSEIGTQLRQCFSGGAA